MQLIDTGWKNYLTVTDQKLPADTAARVTTENKTDWDLVTATGPTKGIILTSFRNKHHASELPKVGDFVVYEQIPGEAKVKIVQVLPRFSKLSRIKNDQEQILGTNINTLFIVHGLDQELNYSQLRRYITMAVAGDTTPVIILNKSDLEPDSERIKTIAKQKLPEVTIIISSAKSEHGTQAIAELIPEGATAAFVGLSGAGKSSLINVIQSNAALETGTTRQDGKGRHTTTRREMVILSNGGVVIDTPGIRTLEQEGDKETAEVLYQDIRELSYQCKFNDCDHIKSAGCAIVAAVKAKEIDQDDYEQYLKTISGTDPDSALTSAELKRKRNQKLKAQTIQYKKYLKKKQ